MKKAKHEAPVRLSTGPASDAEVALWRSDVLAGPHVLVIQRALIARIDADAQRIADLLAVKETK